MTQPHTAQAEPKPRGKLTNADYLAMTPPANTGPRYQLIQGELVEMAGANDPHQVFSMRLSSGLLIQVDALGTGEIRLAPYDVHIDPFNTYQPDLLFVSNARLRIFDVDRKGLAARLTWWSRFSPNPPVATTLTGNFLSTSLLVCAKYGWWIWTLARCQFTPEMRQRLPSCSRITTR